jgi:hypothetical protein
LRAGIKTPKPRKHAIYFIREGTTDRVKIGYSANMEGRLSNLQVGNSSSLMFAGAIPVCSEDRAKQVEADLHSSLHNLHIRGEWYTLTNTDVMRLVLNLTP